VAGDDLSELVFNSITLDETFFFMLPLSFLFGWLFLVAIARGRKRRWLQPSSMGGAFRLTVKHPFEDDYRQPMKLVRWWVYLITPLLLTLPVGMGLWLSLLGPRFSLLDAVVGGGIAGVPIGVGLLLRRFLEGAPHES